MNFNKILLQDIIKRRTRSISADTQVQPSNYFRHETPLSDVDEGGITLENLAAQLEGDDEAEDESCEDSDSVLGSDLPRPSSRSSPPRSLDATDMMTQSVLSNSSCLPPVSQPPLQVSDLEHLQANMELLITTLDHLRDIIAENTLQQQQTNRSIPSVPSVTSRRQGEQNVLPTPSAVQAVKMNLEVPTAQHMSHRRATLITSPSGITSQILDDATASHLLKPLPALPRHLSLTPQVGDEREVTCLLKPAPCSPQPVEPPTVQPTANPPPVSQNNLLVIDLEPSQPTNVKKKTRDKVVVQMRVVFLKVGEIDTLKEIYHAEIFTQAKWREPKLDNFRLENGTAVDGSRYWNPLLSIDNILSETKEQNWLTVQNNEQGEAFLVERRKIKGVFLETLELNDFPLDTQDLSITMTSERPITEVDLVPDNEERSGINLKTFVDQQEWKLHEHIEITKRCVAQEYSTSMKSHPFLSVTCRASRRPGYFYWNVFLVMFFITSLSFATFSLPPEKPENRLQLSFTLFLTSVAFKFVINQSLPKISYLTYMDKYVLMSLAILCIISIWHATVTLLPATNPLLSAPINPTNEQVAVDTASQPPITRVTSPAASAVALAPPEIFVEDLFTTPFPRKQPKPRKTTTSGSPTTPSLPRTRPVVPLQSFPKQPVAFQNTTKRNAFSKKTSFLRQVERDVFIAFGALYIMAHLVFAFWLYFDACKRRREMKEKDRQYKSWLLKNKEWKDTPSNSRPPSRRPSSNREHML